ncbi:MAG: cobalt ECF transporter T component CbiQ [Geminicoccaceae bacterium]|nr:MAG: cobalt ECF transporter T component CbiQ [Geminicoccaceae bacterium]
MSCLDLERGVAESPLNRLDPRFRIVACLVLAFAFSAVTALWLLPLMVALVVGLVAISGLGPLTLWRRLRWPGLIVLLLVALLPWSVGTTAVVQLGPLVLYQEGLATALLIAVRFGCIVAVVLVILTTIPVPVLIHALRSMRVPWLLTDLALLVLRYLHELRHTLERMRVAMMLRGQPLRGASPRALRAWAGLIASLALRSYVRADRIYLAMRVRGYGEELAPPWSFRAGARDWAFLASATAAASFLVLAERAW